MVEDDLSKRLPVANPGDEIGRLATTINGLLSRLEAAILGKRWAPAALRRRRQPRLPLLSLWRPREDARRVGARGDRRAKRSVGAIRREASRMRDLVESLLVLTRGDEGVGLEIGRHDLAAIAERRRRRPQQAGRSPSSTSAPSARSAAWTGGASYRSSILLDNAVRYTPEGGSVAVRVREEGDLAVLEIADTGAGIPEDQLPLIFERFHEQTPPRAGAGLGLSIAPDRRVPR